MNKLICKLWYILTADCLLWTNVMGRVERLNWIREVSAKAFDNPLLPASLA